VADAKWQIRRQLPTGERVAADKQLESAEPRAPESVDKMSLPVGIKTFSQDFLSMHFIFIPLIAD
jgi:hypothetical protein